MERTSLGQRVVTVLLPYLGELTGKRPGETNQRARRGLIQARQLWCEVEADVEARPALAAAVAHAADSADGSARRKLAVKMQNLLQDDPWLAQRVRYRLERAERREALRHRLRESWSLGLLGLSIAIAAVAAVDVRSFRDDMVLAVLALSAVMASVALVYRRFPRAMNWFLVFLVVPLMVLPIDPENTLNDAERAKVFAIFVLTILPGWLYMQFVATRGRSLWEAYVTHLFRLCADDYRNLPEPPRGSVEHRLWAEAGGPQADDPGVLYRRKFEAAYASTVVTSAVSDDPGGARLRGEGFGPVWITTLLTAFGWVAVLAPTYAGAMVFGGDSLGALFPLWEALAFGFVGAYWFNLQSLTRRYFQNDLRTNAYISVITRYVVVATLVAVVFEIRDVAGGEAEVPVWFNAFAFAVGVFPIIGLQIIMKVVTRVVGRIADLENRFPLTHLDGLNMWYEARLVEEGVEDLQNLATADIVDLLLATRVPVGRTVDWIDQAHLYLRVTSPAARQQLRALGIRSATDLQDVFAAGEDLTLAGSSPSRARQVATAIHGDGNADPVSAVDILLAGLDGEANLRHVRAWRYFNPRSTQQPGPADSQVPQIPTALSASVPTTAPEDIRAADVDLTSTAQPSTEKSPMPGVIKA